MSLHWTFYIILANISVAFTEYIYRKGSYENFFVALPVILPLMLISQYGLFMGFRHAPSLFIAGVFFTCVNVAFRLVGTHVLGEQMNVINYCGVGFLVLSAVLLKWRV